MQEGTLPATIDYVALQVPEAYEEITLVDEAFVAAAHGAGVAVHVWTINDEPSMQRLLDLGVDGIITDVPAVCLDLLSRRGLGWRAN